MTTEFPIGLKKAATLCIIESEMGFLLLRRNKEPHLGKYIPIGGKLEPFEDPKTAVLREVKEETGVNIVNAKLLGIMTETSHTKFNWINFIYLARFPNNLSPRSVKSDLSEGELEWIMQKRLSDIPTPTTDRFIYNYVANKEFFVLDAIYDEKITLVRLINEITCEVLFQSMC